MISSNRSHVCHAELDVVRPNWWVFLPFWPAHQLKQRVSLVKRVFPQGAIRWHRCPSENCFLLRTCSAVVLISAHKTRQKSVLGVKRFLKGIVMHEPNSEQCMYMWKQNVISTVFFFCKRGKEESFGVSFPMHCPFSLSSSLFPRDASTVSFDPYIWLCRPSA